MHRTLAALLLAAATLAPPARAGQLRGTVVFPTVHDDVDPRPAARKPLASWRLENGKLRIALEADVSHDVVVVLEPQRPVKMPESEPQLLTISAVAGGALEPRISVAQLGVAVTWKNADAGTRTVTLEDGDTLLPPEPAEPAATREVRFSIAGEYVFIDPDHPLARATVVVVVSPLAARVDERGAFVLQAPEGSYKMKAWWRGHWINLPGVEIGPRGRELTVKLPAEPPRAAVAGSAPGGVPPPAPDSSRAAEKN